MTLRIALAQVTIAEGLDANTRKIADFVARAANEGARVVVFPEGALTGPQGASGDSIEAVRGAAAAAGVYVLLGLRQRRTPAEPPHERLLVIDPDGGILLAYDKMWADPRFDSLPACFSIDGTICNAVICADRWIRAVEELPVIEGSRIIFECSNNGADEWIPDLGWYWYVPRALRNNVFVVFCNSANGHGHSAAIAPDGRMLAALGTEPDALLLADLDLAEATATEAHRRHGHPLLAPFWKAGITRGRGSSSPNVRFEPPSTPARTLHVAAAQLPPGSGVASLEGIIARSAGLDLLALPALSIDADEMPEIARAAREAELMVVVGARVRTPAGRLRSAAFVVDRTGAVATRYDQLVTDEEGPFEAGTSTATMWFDLDGVPGIVTIGRDALWNELAELAALRGAQLHVHLAEDGGWAPLVRRQLHANLASFYTLTVIASAKGDTAIWQDFRPGTNHRRRHGDHDRFCAVPLVEALPGQDLVVATQAVPSVNLHYRAMTERTATCMRPWYDLGAAVIASGAA
ncbi:MAG TPA: nitrilase-related carbon-nitrogen hydrolase [Geminicoccaceae bacterium]|nr:nitrilase-related carbon-nitrogen hydrolase [Geminicoccus sp.]HMU49456.1 nitrilase-related carbon-nitrogen hydrolase [Geminicoccaceae bacterium]